MDFLRNVKIALWPQSKRQILPDVNVTGKVVLITGANSGIGLETGRDLARRGATVILACRNVEAAETAASDIKSSTGSDKVLVRKLDLSSFASIRSLVDTLLKEGDISNSKGLDILINNAGLIHPTAQRGPDTEDGFEVTIQVNYLGPVLLTLLLLPYLHNGSSGDPARIINLSSMAHYGAPTIKKGKYHFNMAGPKYDPGLAYGTSKLYMILFTRHLAQVLDTSEKKAGTRPVLVHAVHPGVIMNPIITRIETWKAWLPIQIARLFAVDSEVGAQTSIYLAVSQDEQVLKSNGQYWFDCQQAPISWQAKDDSLAADLWTNTLDAIKADFKNA